VRTGGAEICGDAYCLFPSSRMAQTQFSGPPSHLGMTTVDLETWKL
jgi:hypothetical protein